MDTNALSGLAEVAAETDADGKVTADYVRGDELISAIRTDGSDKKGNAESYYIYDGHGSTRLS